MKLLFLILFFVNFDLYSQCNSGSNLLVEVSDSSKISFLKDKLIVKNKDSEFRFLLLGMDTIRDKGSLDYDINFTEFSNAYLHFINCVRISNKDTTNIITVYNSINEYYNRIELLYRLEESTFVKFKVYWIDTIH